MDDNQLEDTAQSRPSYAYDFSYVDAVARIALYDDLGAAPRVTKIEPAGTDEFIENLSTTIYEQAKLLGGVIPYTVIREISENFIHANFIEATVSIFDGGNTIRFSDQGPGIPDKDKVQLPGFSSAIEPMKDYIRGVGSGFPIVRDYLDNRHGVLTVEDNVRGGAVITISLDEKRCAEAYAKKQEEAARQSGGSDDGTSAEHRSQHGSDSTPTREFGTQGTQPANIPMPPLTPRERDFLPLFLNEGALGVTEIANLTGAPNSSTYNVLKKLEEEGLILKTSNQKRELTEYGRQIAENIR
ncbi:MAG: ATP-binding protein [Eggerthellaceae bacterium]|jgi:hypothetical protein